MSPIFTTSRSLTVLAKLTSNVSLLCYRYYADGSRLCNFRSSEEQPQVEEQTLWKPGDPVPEKVFGFTFSHNRKLAWAKKHDIGPEKPDYIRVQMAWKEIAKQLPTGHRRVALVHDHKSPVMCLVIANNKTEKEIAKTKDQELIKMFQKVVGEERQPQWFHQTF